MFPLLPLWGLRSILPKNREQLRKIESTCTQKLRSKYAHISNGLIRTGDIVAQLFQVEVLTAKERDLIQQLISIPVSACEQLLNTLMLKDDRAYDCFITALTDTDQKHIIEILKYEDKYLDNEHSLMIQRNYSKLVDNLDVDCGFLLDRLYGSGALIGREVATIKAKPTKHEKSEELLALVSKFSPANFQKVLQALEDSRQKHVVLIMTGSHYSGLQEGSQRNPELQSDSNHPLHHKHQENFRHCVVSVERIETSSILVKRKSIKRLESKFANFPDELQTELSLKVVTLHQKTVLPSDANVEICIGKLLQGFIQQKKEMIRNQIEIEKMRDIIIRANDLTQNSANQFEDKFKTEIQVLSEELLLHRISNRHLTETLKKTVIDLDKEKLKSSDLEMQRDQFQNESLDLLKKRAELLIKFDDAMRLKYESNENVEVLLMEKGTTADNPIIIPASPEGEHSGKRGKTEEPRNEEITDYYFYPTFLHAESLNSEEEKTSFSGLTVLHKELFITFEKSSEVKVFQAIAFSPMRSFSVMHLDNPLDMVSCPVNNCLYISSPNKIYKVDATGKVIANWPIEDGGVTLSVTHDQTVILSDWKRTAFREYSTDGKLICEVRLPSDVHPFHAVKRRDDQFVVSFEHRMVHTVAIVDTNGNVIQSFSGMLKFPKYLLVNSDGYIFVADQKNSRVLMMNPTLESSKVILSDKDKLGRPLRICLDEENSRMFVADIKTDNIRFMVFRLQKHKTGVNEDIAMKEARPLWSNQNLKEDLDATEATAVTLDKPLASNCNVKEDSGGIEDKSVVISDISGNEEEEDEFIDAEDNLEQSRGEKRKR